MAKFTPSGKSSKGLTQKHRVNKKLQDRSKRVKKEGRRMQALGMVRKKRKNIDLPNLIPLKQKVIASLKRKKQQKDEKVTKLEGKQEGEVDLSQAAMRSNIFEGCTSVIKEDFQLRTNESFQKKDSRKYIAQVKKLIEQADIILEVLDARDPLACRCKDLEREALGMQGEKKIILVLNKIDLVPPGNADAWLTYLRREFATVLFKANTQNQHGNLSNAAIYKKTLTQRTELADQLTSSSKAIGADKLLELIKNYSKTEGIKASVTVGVIGYPNVGKSSVINRLKQSITKSLKRSKACGVSSTPGFTTGLQEVIIDQKVKIIDCPGVVFDAQNKESLLLRNIVRVEQLEDPREPVQEILNRVSKNELLLNYKISGFRDLTDFLIQVAQSRGKLLRGGAPDLDTAARVVLQDWNQGKLKYFKLPPDVNQMVEE